MIDTLRQTLKTHIRKRNSFHEDNLSYIVDQIYDLSAILLVSEFYNQKIVATFTNYIEDIDFDTFLRKYPLINNTYQYCVSQTLKLNHETEGKVILLGDSHPNYSTKFSSGDKILQKISYPAIKVFSELQKLNQDEDIKYLFPEFHNNNTLMERQKLKIETEINESNSINYFFRLFGKSSTYLIFLRGIDSFYENMIISKSKPVFFDTECIFTNTFGDENQYPYSHIHTGLYPDKTKGFDTSSLTGAKGGYIQSMLRPYILGENKSPQIKWRKEVKIKNHNIPTNKGKLINPLKYKKDLFTGIDYAYNKTLPITKDFEQQIKDANVFTRILLRPSYIYKAILVGYAYQYLTNKEPIHDYFSRKLKSEGFLVNPTNLSKELLDYEIDSLSNGCIPNFYQNIHDTKIFDSTNTYLKCDTLYASYNVWSKHISNNFDKNIVDLKEYISDL